MSRIDRYIFFQLLGVFGFFALVLVAIYWVNRAVGLLDTLLGDGQSVNVFVQMSLLTIPGVVELIAPMAAFGAAVFTANKLTSDSELVVLQATGFSFFRLGRSVLFFALAVAVMTAIVTNLLVPAAASQLREVHKEISQNSTARFLKEGQFLRPSENVTLYIREISDNGELLDIFFSDTRNPAVTQIYTAQRAFLVNDQDEPKLLMLEGVLQRKIRSENILSVSRFADVTFSLKPFLKEPLAAQRGMKELSTWELVLASPAALRETGSTVDRLRYSGHVRISWPLNAAFTAMIGFATLLIGAFSRNGLWRQILVAIALLLVLYLVHIVMLSRGPSLSGGWILAYATPALGAAICYGVLWYSGRPRKTRANAANANGQPSAVSP